MLKKVLFFIFFCILNFNLQAQETQSLSHKQVPTALQEWIEWVKFEDSNRNCIHGANNSQICAFSASHLEFKINDVGAHFKQETYLLKDSWITLPYSRNSWPTEVKTILAESSQEIPIIRRNNQPQIYLKAGKYKISGQLKWKTKPASIELPEDYGIITAYLDNKKIIQPKIDKRQLLLKTTSNDIKSKNDSVYVDIYRKVKDQVPLEISTHIELRVSGKMRLIQIPHILLKNFSALSVQSDLKTQIQNDGSLKIEVKPGTWSIDFISRAEQKINSITFPKKNKEIWVFEAVDQHRDVKLSGIDIIDSNQSNLPALWKNLPAFEMKHNQKLKLVVQENLKQENQIRLKRKIWLSFDGKSLSIEDIVEGKMPEEWRIDLNSPAQLQAIAVDDEPRLISINPRNSLHGTEIRQGEFQVKAEIYSQEKLSKLNAVHWNSDLDSLSSELNLPPGWKLITATGVDQVSDSWLSQWKLYDIFIVLIISFMFVKVCGIPWGIVSLLGLTLSYQEPWAPAFIWFAVLLGLVFLKITKKGWMRYLFKSYQVASLILLVVLLAPYVYQQFHVALYPNLSAPHSDFSQKHRVYNKRVSQAEKSGYQEFNRSSKRVFGNQISDPAVIGNVDSDFYAQNQVSWKKDSKLQTGKGLPKWQWKQHQLTWNGPVHQDQIMHLFLISPFWNRIIILLQITLLALLAYRILMTSKEELDLNFKFNNSGKQVLSLLFMILIGSTLLDNTPAQAQTTPHPELIKELKEKLKKENFCAESCATVESMHLSVHSNRMKLSLKVHAVQDTLIALPGNSKQWSPQEIKFENNQEIHLMRDSSGTLYVQVSQGIHQLELSGLLAKQNEISIDILHNPPQIFSYQLAGYKIEGIDSNGKVQSNFRLIRTEDRITNQELDLGNYPQFIEVRRHFSIGIQWKVITTIRRIGQNQEALYTQIPLLKNESVTSAHIEIFQGKTGEEETGEKAKIKIPKNQSTITFESTLKQRPQLEMQAGPMKDRIEIWEFEISPLWSFKSQGIQAFYQKNYGKRVPKFHPFTGEKILIDLKQVQVAPGQTKTIEQSTLNIHAGKRSSEANLKFKIKTSLASTQLLKFDENSNIKSVLINGEEKRIRPKDGILSLELRPGDHNIEIKWIYEHLLTTRFHTPTIEFVDSDYTNSRIKIYYPKDRWILWMSGPGVGPQVLIWSYLVLIIIFAFVLSRIKMVPLKWWQWLLLGLGLSQLHIFSSLFIVASFIFVAWSGKHEIKSAFKYDLRQIIFVCLIFAAASVLIGSIENGLLGSINMHISGMNSRAYYYQWYLDRGNSVIQEHTVVSLPLYTYRICMLIWSLWLAWSITQWSPWIYKAFTQNGAWKKLFPKKDKKK